MYSYCSVKVKRELFITHAESLSVSMTADKQMQSSTQHTNSDETDWAKQDEDTVHQLDGFYGRQTSTQFNRFELPVCICHYYSTVPWHCSRELFVWLKGSLGTIKAREAIVSTVCLLPMQVIKNENCHKICMHEGSFALTTPTFCLLSMTCPNIAAVEMVHAWQTN